MWCEVYCSVRCQILGSYDINVRVGLYYRWSRTSSENEEARRIKVKKLGIKVENLTCTGSSVRV